MPLINCKVELKLKWTKYCVLSGAGHDNIIIITIIIIIIINNNNIFTIKDTKLYVPVVTLLAKDNKKLTIKT